MDPLLKLGDVAGILQVSRSTAFRLKKEQNWPHVRLGTEIRFTQADLEAIIQMNHQQPTTKTVPNVGTRAKRRNNK